METNERLRSTVLGIMRIAVAFLYWSHGAQKFMGWFGGFGSDGGTAALASRFGAAGVIEFFGGLLVMLGLFTRPVAFLIAGEMAVTYFWMHMPRGGFWPWLNRGEVVACYAFVFFYLAVAGSGAFSLDRLLARRREASTG
jgi:putative oxidoreductase